MSVPNAIDRDEDDDVLSTRVLTINSRSCLVPVLLELTQNESSPEELSLMIRTHCLRGGSDLSMDSPPGVSFDLTDVGVIRTLGELLVQLADCAERRGMLDALRAHRAAGLPMLGVSAFG